LIRKLIRKLRKLKEIKAIEMVREELSTKESLR
jgi:hypothetical protein